MRLNRSTDYAIRVLICLSNGKIAYTIWGREAVTGSNVSVWLMRSSLLQDICRKGNTFSV
ncbi:MAG TPA: hypothetical protein H9765_07515 [Candidatus Mediterraneibacter intestinigallinarum]|nr:hypothetical protein [Candidatus Mediterraneibacter intestinigallinarum]